MVKREVRRKNWQPQGRNGSPEAGKRRGARITPETPYGECTERISAFGGLLALVKFLDLIGFEQAFAECYVRPRRRTTLGCYRMVTGILMLLFIGFQRLGWSFAIFVGSICQYDHRGQKEA